MPFESDFTKGGSHLSVRPQKRPSEKSDSFTSLVRDGVEVKHSTEGRRDRILESFDGSHVVTSRRKKKGSSHDRNVIDAGSGSDIASKVVLCRSAHSSTFSSTVSKNDVTTAKGKSDHRQGTPVTKSEYADKGRDAATSSSRHKFTTESSYGTDKSKGKTLAQSRLLRKRKEYEALIRKGICISTIESKLANLRESTDKMTVGRTKSNIPDSSSPKVSQSKTKDLLKRRIREDKQFQERIATSERVKAESFTILASSPNDSAIGDDEEMDWEPSVEEDMIEHIKSMRKNLDLDNKLSGDIVVRSNVDVHEKCDAKKLIIVFDTNVFISSLTFIKEIRDTFIPGFGLPNLFIPWRILQELDRLKESDQVQLRVSAVRAVRFINENFTSKHPRVNGQSFAEFTSMMTDGCTSPDDEILQVCCNLQKDNRKRTVVLITNDKNLESKAVVSNIEAYSRSRFVKDKLGLTEKKSSVGCIESDSMGSEASSSRSKTDLVYCKLKETLKTFLEEFLETEMKFAFENKWLQIVARKPPWSLMDMLECIVKHWRAVFSLILRREFLGVVEDLKQQLVKYDKGEESEITEMIETSHQLLNSIQVEVGSRKPYLKTLDVTKSKIKKLLHPQQSEESEHHIKTSCDKGQEMQSTAQLPLDRQQCIENVKNLFQIIWDQVKSFCVRLFAISETSPADVIEQTKCQLPHVLRNVHELVEIIEKILSVTACGDDLRTNPIVLHFTNFLVNLNVCQIDNSELRNLPGYVGIVCSEETGRVILSSLANDMKQFAAEMMNGGTSLGFL